MNLLLIGSEWTTLPYIVKLDDSSLEGAVEVFETMNADVKRDMYTPFFIVDLDSGESYRVMRATGYLESGYVGPKYEISKTAFVRVGSETPPEYFDELEEGEA